MSKNLTADYLAKYAETRANNLADKAFNALKSALKNVLSFKHVVVIPCFDESAAFAERLYRGALWSESVLVIVVINQTHDSPPSQKNQALWQYFIDQPAARQLDEPLILSGLTHLADAQTASAFLVVDCFRRGQQLPEKQGVGVARKLGCDVALSFQSRGLVSSDWLYSTDADAHLPDTYFAEPTDKAVAMVFEHRHIQVSTETESDPVFAATQLYEQAINYYTAGLAWAGSPYAFPTLGSCLAVRGQAYAHSRGFPKRSAAEDFYLLNKLAKIGTISWRKDIVIQIESRLSGRNPFGTGPSVKSILDQQQTIDTYGYYAPESFVELKTLLSFADQNLLSSGLFQLPEKVEFEKIKGALNHLQVDIFVSHLQKQNLKGRLAVKAWHDWFDAFKTLKFIRYMQQHHFPSLALQRCLEQARFS